MSNQPDNDSTQPDFWSQSYVTGKTPWQLDRVPAQLESFIRALPARRNILIPGCGQDHRTIGAFCDAGHRVTAIDFSPIAVETARKALKPNSADILLGDFFQHEFDAEPFDLIYERTFLCSLPPSIWKNYIARVAQLLRSNGRLVGFFYYGKESDPPPYPLTEEKAQEIFNARFELKEIKPVTDSLAIFGGKEKWQEWQRL